MSDEKDYIEEYEERITAPKTGDMPLIMFKAGDKPFELKEPDFIAEPEHTTKIVTEPPVVKSHDLKKPRKSKKPKSNDLF